MNISVSSGIVEKKLSESLYLIKIKEDTSRIVRFSSKLRMHYKALSIGAKVHVELYKDENKYGRVLSPSEFKTNGWEGWTDEYEPKLKDS